MDAVHRVWDVVEAVTALIVQREACGLRDAKQETVPWGRNT